MLVKSNEELSALGMRTKGVFDDEVMKLEELISWEEAELILVRFDRHIGQVSDLMNDLSLRKDGFRDSSTNDSKDKSAIIGVMASQVGMLARSSCEHFLTFSACVRNPRLTIVPYVCVRGGIEASGIAAWIADPKLVKDERLSRSFAFRLEGLHQQVKYAEGINEMEMLSASARLKSVEDKADRMSFEVSKSQKAGKSSINGVRWPGSTKVIEEALDLEREYRLLSAMAHGHAWAITQLSYRKAGQSELAEQHMHPIAIVWLCRTAARALGKAIWCASELLNGESMTTQRVLNGLYDDLLIHSGRPWST